MNWEDHVRGLVYWNERKVLEIERSERPGLGYFIYMTTHFHHYEYIRSTFDN